MNALLSALADGAIAVTPNRRLARRLHAEFDAALAASGQRAWPTPAILPYRGVADSALGNDSRARERCRTADAIERAQAIALWQRVIEDSGATLADMRGAAALASDAWSHVHAWGAGGESWRSWRQQGDEQDPSLFAAWADTYLARTRRLGVLDIAQAGDAIAAQAAVIGRRISDDPDRRIHRAHAAADAAVLGTRRRGRELAAARQLAGASRRRSRVRPRPRRATKSPRRFPGRARSRSSVRQRASASSSRTLAERRDAVLALAQDILDPASILPGHARSGAPFELSLGVRLTQVPLVGAALDLITLERWRH